MVMSNNVHSTSIPKDLLEQAMAKLDEVMELLKAYLYSLTPEDRQDLLKMGDKSLAFVEKTSELASANPLFVPAFVSLDDLKTDLADALNLRTLSNRLHQLSREVDDTVMLAGSEAFTQALSIYSMVKQAARDNVPGAEVMFDELQKRFALGRPKKTVE
jgi:hypothetical protein